MTLTMERQYFVAAGHGKHVAIDTTALTDDRLSWKAKGLHYYIRTQLEALSNQQELVAAGPDGRDSVGTGIRELMQNKYLYMQQKRDEFGQFICAIYISFPAPVHMTEEQLSTLLSTGSVHMSTGNVPTSPPQTAFPDTDKTGAEDVYYLTSLNKHISNKSLRDLSRNMEGGQPPSASTEKTPKEILALWNDQPALPTHKTDPKYKKYRQCLKALKTALLTHTPETVTSAIRAYNNLIENPHTMVGTKSPHRVGLDEFFKFSAYTQSVVDGFKEGTPLHGLTSWFMECAKGSDYLFKKYARVRSTKHPEVARTLEEQLVSSTGWRPAGHTQDTTAFRLAADRVVEFHARHRASLPPYYLPVHVARDLVAMACDFKKPHPGILANEHTWDAFERYLVDLGILAQYDRGGYDGFTATARCQI